MRLFFSKWHYRLGYVYIKMNRRWIKRSRYIMERVLGRPLLPFEVVHHKNEERDDDRPSNLAVMFKWCHNSKHHKGQQTSLGRKLSEDAKRRISEAQKENTNRRGCINTEEHRRKISEAKRRNKCL